MIGSASGTTYGYDKDGKPFLTKDPKLLINDNDAGKPESIYLMIGRRPHAAFGNTAGDQQMLEYTAAGDGRRLAVLILHDDAEREYAYGPAEGLPDTKVGTITQALYDEAKKDGWIVVTVIDSDVSGLGFARGPFRLGRDHDRLSGLHGQPRQAQALGLGFADCRFAFDDHPRRPRRGVGLGLGPRWLEDFGLGHLVHLSFLLAVTKRPGLPGLPSSRRLRPAPVTPLVGDQGATGCYAA